VISTSRKSARPPFWANLCVLVAIAFATVSHARVPTPAVSLGEQAFDQVRKVEFCAKKGAAKVPPRKSANAERLQWLTSRLNVGVTPALVRFSFTLVAEKHSVVSIPAGTFHKRAPPA
jgi:hypothetical protein